MTILMILVGQLSKFKRNAEIMFDKEYKKEILSFKTSIFKQLLLLLIPLNRANS